MHCTDVLPLVLALPGEGLEVSPSQTTAPVIAVAPRELASVEFTIENVPQSTLALIQENMVELSVDMWFGGCSAENSGYTFTKIVYGDKPVPIIRDFVCSAISSSDSPESRAGNCSGIMVFRDVWRAPSDADGIPKTLAPLRVRVIASAKNSAMPLFITNLSHGFIMRGKRMQASRKYIAATKYPPPTLTPDMQSILTADFENHVEMSDSLAASIATRLEGTDGRLDASIRSVITSLSNNVGRVAYEAKKSRSLAPDGESYQALTAGTLNTLLETIHKLDQPDPAVDSDDYEIGSTNAHHKGVKDSALASLLLDLRGTVRSNPVASHKLILPQPDAAHEFLVGSKRPRTAMTAATSTVAAMPPFVHPVYPDFYPMAMMPAPFPASALPDAFRSFMPVMYPDIYQQFAQSQPSQPAMSGGAAVMMPQRFMSSAAAPLPMPTPAMPTFSSFMRAMQG